MKFALNMVMTNIAARTAADAVPSGLAAVAALDVHLALLFGSAASGSHDR